MALIATPGDPAANSFETVAEADAYFQTRPGSDAWFELAPTEKEAALIQATRLITVGICWTGTPTTETQALPWPRTGMAARNGGLVADTAVPLDLKWATSELALALLTRDRVAENQADALGLKELQVGPIDLVFRDPQTGDAVPASDLIPDSVMRFFLKSWLCQEAADLVPFLFEVT